VPDDPHRVTSVDEVREILGEPSEIVRSKTLARLDRHCRAFIARSPFVLLATAGRNGRLDVSPRGGPAGFVEVAADGASVAFGDAKGNRLADSSRNIVETGWIGMLFLIPGFGETLRVNGRAHLTRDPAVRVRHSATANRLPPLAVVVEVEEAFLHCAAAMIRSSLWKPDAWPDIEGLPSAARIWKDHASAPEDVEELEAWLADGYINDIDW
jgi:PPOX class probable FMN-dependent enzyme